MSVAHTIKEDPRPKKIKTAAGLPQKKTKNLKNK
jgi:hypothetical protein